MIERVREASMAEKQHPRILKQEVEVGSTAKPG
jgi:hypothetical protein